MTNPVAAEITHIPLRGYVPQVRVVVWLCAACALLNQALFVAALPHYPDTTPGQLVRSMAFVAVLDAWAYAAILLLLRFWPPAARWALLAAIFFGSWQVYFALQHLHVPNDTNYLFAMSLWPLGGAPLCFILAALVSALWNYFGDVAMKVALVLFAVVSVVVLRGLQGDQPARLARLLNLSALPASVTAIDCHDSGFVDAQVDCAFEIDPRDFDKLLVGRSYRAAPDTGVSNRRGQHLGSDFRIAMSYGASWTTPDPAMKRHHDLSMRTDSARRRVILSYSGY